MRWHSDLSSIDTTPSLAILTQAQARLADLFNEPLITQLDMQVDREAATQLARHFKKRSDVTMVIGTGGASLGAQALLGVAEARRARSSHRVEFLDNIDPETLSHAFSGRDLTRISFLFISKSGETVETLAAAVSIVDRYKQAGLLPDLTERSAVITTSEHTSLGQLAVHYGFALFLHPDIGGRYSVFTLVGLLPALLAGIDIAAVVQGATQWVVGLKAAFPQALAHQPLLQSVAWLWASQKTHPIHVVMPYADSLRAYTRWFQQLWAESLSKQGDGSTAFAAIGALDQHSQLQLFLDGPKDKTFTFVLPKRKNEGPVLSDCAIASLDYLRGHRMGAVLDASAEATVATLRAHHIGLRVLRCETLDMFAVGELMMMQMVETILVAAMMQVNPYDQPAVEQGKALTRHYLRHGV